MNELAVHTAETAETDAKQCNLFNKHIFIILTMG